MDRLTIGDVARQAGVRIETLRHYEREGLVASPPRSVSNYRLYPEDTVRRVRFIKRAQELGFSLKEIKELLALRIAPGSTRADVRKRADTKMADIEEKIQHLRAMKKALVRLTESCCGSGPASECPILESLSLDEKEK